ncbi:MAG: DapH/DapD/GlmU-related protein [Clostridia bacterium]
MKFKHGKNIKLINKRSIFIDKSVVVGNNVTIYENNRIEGNTIIQDNCIILPGNHIINCEIDSNCKIEQSNIEGAKIGSDTHIGPFSRIRPDSIIGKNVKIGNFVEIKNSIIGDGSKASHLAYVGDAEISKNCNIGCGAIFINYNGKSKNKIKVGDNSFIGSNCNLIAPLNIAENCYICAGTTVTKDTLADDFVIGRVKQEVKPNMANKYLKKE